MIDKQMEIKPQIAVITCAAGLYGSEIIKQLLEYGFYVAALDKSKDDLQRLVDLIGYNDRLAAFPTDVADIKSVEMSAHAIESFFGDAAVSVLINQAGIVEKNLCLADDVRKTSSTAKHIIDYNLTGPFHCTMVFSKYMVRQRQGRIINIASIAGTWGVTESSGYSAATAGLLCASESWATELGKLNISVTALAPGICKPDNINSEKQALINLGVENVKSILPLIPMRRFGTSSDIAEVVMFLATCKTNYLNSAVISIDGGIHVGSL